MESGSLCGKPLTEDTVQSHPLVASVLCWGELGGATSVPEEAALRVYCGCRKNSLGHSVLIWFLTAVWTGNAGILCLCLPLTQAPRIALSSVGPKPLPLGLS